MLRNLDTCHATRWASASGPLINGDTAARLREGAASRFVDQGFDVTRQENAVFLGGPGCVREAVEIGVLVAVERGHGVGREGHARAAQPTVDVVAQWDGAVLSHRYFHLGEPDATHGQPVLVPDDLRRV